MANHKRIRRLMREHGLQPRRRRRFVRTTDSDHDQPIFRDRRKEVAVDGPDRLWVADLTYVAIATGFVYVAVILDAWSRRVVGYAIGRTLDARLTVAALKAAIERRQPPPGCVHHSDRGSQYAARIYRELLAAHGLVGSMGRRANPYDNAKAESFIKTLKVEAVYPMAYETFDAVAADLPHFIGNRWGGRPPTASLCQGGGVEEPLRGRRPWERLASSGSIWRSTCFRFTGQAPMDRSPSGGSCRGRRFCRSLLPSRAAW